MSRIVGIDLGTSTSEIACIVDGAPVVIPNALGNLVTPSVVHIGKEGEVLVGEPAAEYLFTRPECTFMEVKRLTGSDKILRAHNVDYTPEELQSKILQYLCDCAEAFLDERPDRAVITVPAYFTDVQRRMTAKAGELAGLKVERILNEPTAAALDYGLSNLAQCKNILVYDLGGGTLDITVLELFEGVIDVKASCGNNQLGGKDFDEIIMGMLADASGDERALMRLKKAAEECKIALSTEEDFEIVLPFLLTAAGGKPISVEKTLTREEFEQGVKDKVDSTRTPMMAALADAGLSPSDLDIVLLVGGSTRIPCVKRLVEESLSLVPQSLVDPDLTVVRGAAIQAGILEGILTGEQELVLTDVCPYTLGTAVVNEGLYEDRLVFDPLIPRNITIPVEQTKLYYPRHDYQTTVCIEVYQGDCASPENNERLGDVLLTGIPPARTGKEPVEVTFAYDMNGILQVKAVVVSTGKEVSAEISTTGIQPRAVLDLSKWESAKGAKRQRPVIRKAEKKIESDHDETGELELLVRQIKEALLLCDEKQVESLREELVELLEEPA
ncbi:MAG: Hsp70 family protein [Peptococcaceae bacterium]|nr:Hsp70 family protein [Peptococcaceae bacterium]